MSEKRYELRFLPLFEEDLNEIVDYITLRLHNSAAANALVDAVEAAINERQTCAEALGELQPAAPVPDNGAVE